MKKLPRLTRSIKKTWMRDSFFFLIGFAANAYIFLSHNYELTPTSLSAPYVLKSDSCRICFPPGCLKPIINLIQQAKKNLWLQAYSFTSPVVAEALCQAYARGVDVQVLVDSSQLTARSSQIHHLLAHGIPVAIDRPSGLAHNKIIIADKAIVVTGSYNFTQAAEKRNAENVLFIHQVDIAQHYAKNFRQRYAKASPCKLRTPQILSKNRVFDHRNTPAHTSPKRLINSAQFRLGNPSASKVNLPYNDSTSTSSTSFSGTKTHTFLLHLKLTCDAHLQMYHPAKKSFSTHTHMLSYSL